MNKDRPNILFIMSDQHRADAMGCEGRTDVATPNLDDLAKTGVRFTRAYCNNAICGASRNSLQTGMLPRTLGVATFEEIGYPGEIFSIQQWLKQHGYRTGAFGKRHLSTKADYGWDTTASTLKNETSSQQNWWSWIKARNLEAQADRDWKAEHGKDQAEPMGCLVSELPDDATMEAWTADRTIDFLEDSRNSHTPFFAFCSFYRPHQPYTPTRSWFNSINAESIKLPPSLDQPPDQLPTWLAEIRRRYSTPWCCGAAAEDHELYRFYIQCYLALVTEVDHHVGRLLDALENLGLHENTIVVYTADHGDFVAHHGMVEKAAIGHNVYEDTLRVPLIFNWPSKFAPAVRDDLVQLVDIYPTLCDLVELPSPESQTLQGASLANCLQQQQPIDRDYIISENGSQSTVISDRYKLGRWTRPLNPEWDFRQNADMLFDRLTDPHEIHNRIGDLNFKEVIEQMCAWLDQYMANTPNDAWQALAASCD